MERREGPTPNGGAYSEAFYFNKDGVEVVIDDASRIIIKEYTEDGRLLETTYGSLKSKEPVEEAVSEEQA